MEKNIEKGKKIMEEMLIGTYIRQKRLEKNWTQEKLSDGICDAATLSRIENNERPPSIRVAKALLQKMGFSSAPYVALLGRADILAERLQKEIRDDAIRFEEVMEEEQLRIRERVLKKLSKLESLCGEDDRFVRQFVLSMRATVGTPEGPYRTEERLELLLEAIRLTIPNFDLKKVSRFRYSMNEVALVNKVARTYARAGDRKKAISILSQLLQYIEKNNQELDKFAAQFCLVVHNCAIDLAVEKRYKEAAELAQRGWDVSVEKGDYQFLPGFVAILAGCEYFQGNRERSAELYVQACVLYKTLRDERNLAIMKREMKEYLGLEPPYQMR